MEEYGIELLKNKKRVDGRGFNDFRPIEIKPNIIEKAEGSASAKIGKTFVIAGVKIELSKPFPDTPNEGTLTVNAEFTPLASPDFQPGPPGEDAIEVARLVDRVVRASNSIQLEKLCIQPAEKVLGVFIDIHVINDEGNILDASVLASVAALWNTKIPKVEGEKIVRGEFTGNLPVAYKPVTVTVCKFNENFLVDPSQIEEKIIERKVSFGIRDDDIICAVQKMGKETISFGDVEKALEIAMEKSKELRKLI